jgi:glutamate synthase (NADPH/NADH) small chain
MCEYACVLGLNDDAVTIRENELAIIEHGFRKGLVRPGRIKTRSGKKAAIVGSGPAGLSCAAQLNRARHHVTVFERDERLGGILRYGIPDFKLEKSILDRRIALWEKEGVVFKAGVDVGRTYPFKKLLGEYDAILLAGGSRVPRDLNIEGRELEGIHFAMDYLTQSNRRAAGERFAKDKLIDAKGKKVVVIGGGDTGADCVGTAHRQGAACVVQIEVLPKPPEWRSHNQPWPSYPALLKTTSSHEEGGIRHWEVTTRRFIGEGGAVKRLVCRRPDGEFMIEADLVILAIGFLYPDLSGIGDGIDLALDERGNVKTDSRFKTSVEKVFSAGDMRRGQSLVVWAVAEGRNAARSIDAYLVSQR